MPNCQACWMLAKSAQKKKPVLKQGTSAEKEFSMYEMLQ